MGHMLHTFASLEINCKDKNESKIQPITKHF